MATIRQKRALVKIVENSGNVTRGMIDAGYSEASANSPKFLTESKGFKELMAEFGLTEDLIATSLVEDIKDKPKNRVQELSLGAKILKMTDSEAPINNFVPIQVIINQVETTTEKSRLPQEAI